MSEVSEIICTRISHDLIGNIGAVANAVELLEDGDMDFIDDIKSILSVSSGVLSSRLKFFRMAFGLTNSKLEDAAVVVKTCEDYIKTVGNQKNYPIELRLKLKNESRFGRLLMLCVMIAADVMIKGGLIEGEEAEGKLVLAVSSPAPLSADKISRIKEISTGLPSEKEAQFAPAYYLAELLKEMSLPVKISEYNGMEMIIG